jgi:hypothetical protein
LLELVPDSAIAGFLHQAGGVIACSSEFDVHISDSGGLRLPPPLKLVVPRLHIKFVEFESPNG